MPPGVDLDAALADDPVVGGAVARIETTAADSVEAYRDLWRSNPAFAGLDDDVIVAVSDGDMDPNGPPYRPGIRPESIVADARELRVDEAVVDAAEHVQCPVWILRATRGLRNGPRPFVAEQDAADYAARHTDRDVRVIEVEDTNHFSIVLSGHGARVVVRAIREAVALVGTGRS